MKILTKDTFLQKLLGDNYKWYFLLRFRLKSRSVSAWDTVFFVVGHFLILFGTLLTWWLVSGKIIDFNLREKFSYFIIGELFFCLTFTFAEFMGLEFLRGFIVACSGFFLKAINGIILNYTFLSSLLMGRSFPLNLLIDNFWINLANPFSFTFYHPVQIYLGKYDNFQTAIVFLGRIFWCAFLYFLAKFVFKMGLKRNESLGL